MMKQTVKMVRENNGRSPDMPGNVSWRMVKDHGDTAEVEIISDNRPPVTLKADIWRRATDEEIDKIDAVLSDPPEVEGMTPKQIVRVWRDTLEIKHTDRLYDVVRAIAVELFGESRTDVLLAESER